MLISIASVFLGAFLSWFKKARPLSILLLIVGYAAALVSGFVQPIGIAGVIVVALLAWLCNQTLNGVRGVALHIIFLVWAGLLFLHVLPGFQKSAHHGAGLFHARCNSFQDVFQFRQSRDWVRLDPPVCSNLSCQRFRTLSTGCRDWGHLGDCSYFAAGSLAGRHPLGAKVA